MKTWVSKILKRLTPRSVHTKSCPVSMGGIRSKRVLPTGVERFDQRAYLDINEARIAHLDSLGLPLEGKTVLDVGSGVGHLAQYFVEKKCRVVCIDARQENIDELRSRFPNLCAYVADVERESVDQFGRFDVVFCYGLLYHLESPLVALRNMASVCQELLLLESVVCDHDLPILQIVDEPPAVTQAVRGLGCRPSPSYVTMALNHVGFSFVYMPRVPPEHPNFRFQWKSNLDWKRDGRLLRSVFVASRARLEKWEHKLAPQNRCGGGTR